MIIRLATLADAGELADLINRIIVLGGTTAHQEPFRIKAFTDHSLTAPGVRCCHMAERDGRALGFQPVGPGDRLPPDWLKIETFVAPGLQGQGIGQGLFAATVAAARAGGFRSIAAVIRADNVPGLAYHSRLGFHDYDRNPAWALKDRRVVGRVSKRFDP